jgi:predicted site-specific integrase-resolvase
MPYTLAAAAAACGVNKSTVLRAIKAGKITGTKDEHGEWHVEPAELHRVYQFEAALSALISPRRPASVDCPLPVARGFRAAG